MQTYSRKKRVDSGSPAVPISPPQKKTVWSGFLVGKKQKKTAVSPAAQPHPHVDLAVGRYGGDDDDDDIGQDEEDVSSRTEQSFLDLEEKGMTVEKCTHCGMRYSKGVKSDEAVHRRHCKRFRRGEKWPMSLGEIQRSYPDGTSIVRVVNVDGERSDGAAKGVMEIVDLELGFADSDAPGEGGAEMQTLWVLIHDSRAVGALISVPINCALRVDCSDDIDGDDEIVRCNSESEIASIGVSRIWVHRDHRKKGYAIRLLNVAFADVSKTGVAFSQPTQAGRKLAEHWFGRRDFLVFR